MREINLLDRYQLRYKQPKNPQEAGLWYQTYAEAYLQIRMVNCFSLKRLFDKSTMELV